jgi:hypothetical protein
MLRVRCSWGKRGARATTSANATCAARALLPQKAGAALQCHNDCLVMV